MAILNEKQLNEITKTHGGLYAILAHAIREHGASKVIKTVLVNDASIISALTLFIDSRMHALDIVKRVLKLSNITN